MTTSSKRRYYCEELEDGSIYLSQDGKTEYDNTGSIILAKSQRDEKGKVDWESGKRAIIDQAKAQTKSTFNKDEITRDEFIAYLDYLWDYNKNRAKREAQAAQERADRKHKAAAKILNQRLEAGVFESNAENIYLLLTYLNTQNWGGWKLPTMTIGYSCNQYDCDGKTATTISLDKPIEYKEKMVSKFEVGAPHGHLTQYVKIRCANIADEIAAAMKEF